MKNSYIIAGIIIVAAILGFTFGSKKTEAPVKELVLETSTSTEAISLEAGVYELDTESSKVLWQGEYLTGLKENGSVDFKSGSLEVSEGSISGAFEVDMFTIDSNPRNERLIGHLKNDDFFSVEKYPSASFKLKSIAPTSEEGAKSGRYVVAGDLTIKGITKPISIIVTITRDQNDKNILIARSTFAINRADWEIKYNSPTFFSNLGEKIIRDAVTLELDLQAKKVIQ